MNVDNFIKLLTDMEHENPKEWLKKIGKIDC
jgi:hypothetical protein